MFRTPMIAAFLTVILGMAVMMGYLTQWLLNRPSTQSLTTAISDTKKNALRLQGIVGFQLKWP